MDKFNLPKVLQGPRIRLVQLDIKMTDEIFQLVERSRERLHDFMDWEEKTKRPADVLKFIKGELKKLKKGTLFPFAIKLDRKIIGLIGTHDIDWKHAKSEVGYWLATEFNGHGYMTEAVKVLETAMFERGFNRIAILCDTENKRSAAVPKRLGYRLEAHFKERTLLRGKYKDDFLFAKVKSEWIKTR
jgi:ribosomal-protein-serine acetyltransferase